MENKKSKLEKDIIKLQNDINENEGAIKDLSEKLGNKTILQANRYKVHSGCRWLDVYFAKKWEKEFCYWL